MHMYNFISLSNEPLFTRLLPNSNISSLVKSCPIYNWNVYFLFVEFREFFTCSEYKTFVRYGFASSSSFSGSLVVQCLGTEFLKGSGSPILTDFQDEQCLLELNMSVSL